MTGIEVSSMGRISKLWWWFWFGITSLAIIVAAGALAVISERRGPECKVIVTSVKNSIKRDPSLKRQEFSIQYLLDYRKNTRIIFRTFTDGKVDEYVFAPYGFSAWASRNASPYSEAGSHPIDPDDSEKPDEELLQRVKLKEGQDYILEPGQPLVIYRIKSLGKVYEKTIELAPPEGK
jgi:hypothetical protein